MANKNKKHLLTSKDLSDDIFSGFADEKDRIRYISNNYGEMSIAKAFGIYHNVEISKETKTNKTINSIQEITLGSVYNGIVKDFSNGKITFDLPGVKDELICKENFSGCVDEINNYLLTHDNKMLFEVREKKNNSYIVSVINAYYRLWVMEINKAITQEYGIPVHIDSLTLNQSGKGGYICHTLITPLYELTGKKYTHSVFIPGSHIVLNIERDFERWIDKDVIIVPQKFVEFRRNMAAGVVENSLVGSRKRVLQIEGMNNMMELYQRWVLGQSENAKYEPETLSGTVTGIINSNNKTGIFVELDGKYITGLMPVDSIELLDYKPGDQVFVKIQTFEIQDGKEPFVQNKKGKIIKANVRPVFMIA